MISRRNRFQSLVNDILKRGRISRKRKSEQRKPRAGVEIMETRNLLSATSFVINEILADPAASSADGDANGDGTRSSTQDEFVEIVNVSGSAVDISGFTLADGFSNRHVFPAGTVVGAGQAVVVFGGGTPTGDFGGAIVQTASTGGLGLNNGGDTVNFSDGTDTVSHAYAAEGSNDQSVTRDPDLTGSFVQHSTTTSGLLFSPGFLNDGTTPFGAAASQPIDIVIDYSFDTQNFFAPNTSDGQAARQLLETAAHILESRIFDSLAAITPGGANTWTASFFHPGTGANQTIVDLEVPENQLIVFAGGQNLPAPAR